MQAIPGADGAGLTLLEADGRTPKSAPFVTVIDDIQNGPGEGPCIRAAATGKVVRTGHDNCGAVGAQEHSSWISPTN